MDLNCDMGELEDAAHEAALMEFVTSANIACGGHAGDAATMERTVRLALARGVRIGAHPGYPDRANFGRVAMDLAPAEIERTVLEQIRRLDAAVQRSVADPLVCASATDASGAGFRPIPSGGASRQACRVGRGPSGRADFSKAETTLGRAGVAARATGAPEIGLVLTPRLDREVCPTGIVHVKPHGALYNVAARDAETARAIGRATLAWNPRAILFGLAGSPALDLWREMGLTVAAEAFADRRYEPDGSLRSRKLPDALIADPQEAAAQALRFAQSGVVQTICVHGDTPGAVAILKACRDALA